jgi:hypothetical protein
MKDDPLGLDRRSRLNSTACGWRVNFYPVLPNQSAEFSKTAGAQTQNHYLGGVFQFGALRTAD